MDVTSRLKPPSLDARLRGHDVLVPCFLSFLRKRESRFLGRRRFRDEF